MSHQFSTATLKLGARSMAVSGVSATVLALLSGYQQPSNAAIVSASTTSTVPLLIAENSDQKRALLRAAQRSNNAADAKNPTDKQALSEVCDRAESFPDTKFQQPCRLKVN